MNDSTGRVPAVCPACSPESPTAHEVLQPGGQATARCTECGHVHKTSVDDEPLVERRVIVSQEGDSFETTTELPPDDRLVTGEEFLVETAEGVFTVRLTSLEIEGGDRTESARVEDVRTVWTRAVGNVGVNLTLHPKSGSAPDAATRSVKIHVPGNEEFVVSESHGYGDEAFTVEGILLREDATGYGFRKLDHAGDAVAAKDVKRLYARDESTSAWSAW